MNEKALISVVIPAYNAEQTIEQCVHGVLKQRFQNFEIIIVDDGSCDNTFVVCNRLAEIDSRISVIHKENGGPSSARNAGMQKACGKYIAFIDSDDCVEDTYLEALITPTFSNDTDVVICGITTSYQKQGYTVLSAFKKNKTTSSHDEISALIFESFENGTIYSPWNKLYKMDIITKNHILFPLSKEPIEDILFNCEYMKHVNSISVTTACPYIYCKNDIESEVTKFRKNIQTVSTERSNATLSLFTYWNMNGAECEKWLAQEYIGGKSDCVSNCYRKGANLNFFEKCKLFKQFIIKDEKYHNAVNKCHGMPLHYDKKILVLLSKTKSALIMACAYNILFFFRYRLKNIYYLFRKNSAKKD